MQTTQKHLGSRLVWTYGWGDLNLKCRLAPQLHPREAVPCTNWFFKAVLRREAEDISGAAILGTTTTFREIAKDMAFPFPGQQPTSPRHFPSINACPWECGYRHIKI